METAKVTVNGISLAQHNDLCNSVLFATDKTSTGTICVDVQNGPVTSISMANQSDGFVTTVLPSEGFSLIDLGLEKLPLDEVHHQSQYQGGGDCQESDDSDDGVNLVVKATYWWCKDCNVKQKFGCGEDMETHLRLRHRIDNRTKETNNPEMCMTELAEPCPQVDGESTPISETITSVYTIPSNSVTVEDQAVDTLIVFDDATTLQVLTKPSEDKYIDIPSSSPKPLEDHAEDAPHSSQDTATRLEVEAPKASQSLRYVDESALPQLKPIPVIPALPPASPLPLSVSPHTLSKVEKPRPSQPLTFHPSSEISTNSTSNVAEAQSFQNNNARPTTDLDGSSAKSDFQPSAGQVETRKPTCQEADETLQAAQLQDCRVQVKRLPSGEVRERKAEQSIPSVTSDRENSSPEKMAKQKPQNAVESKSRSTEGAAPALCSSATSLRRSSRRPIPSRRMAAGRSPSPSAKKARQSHHTGSKSPDSSDKVHTNSKLSVRRSSGRKIRKPARYITGSANEGEKEDKKNLQDSDAHLEDSSSSDTQWEQDSPRKSERRLRKRKVAAVAADTQSEAKSETSPAVKTAPVVSPAKKAKVEKYCCQDCGRKFRFENKFNKHVEMYVGQTMQQCSVCDVKLHNMDLLNVHIYHIHKTKESTSCITCEKSLGSKRSLLNHLLTHPNAKGQTVANLIKDSCETHQCSICNETIITGEGRVEKHYLAHNKPTSHTCQKCNRSFHHRSQLYNHLKEHGESDEVLLQSGDHRQPQDSTNSKSNHHGKQSTLQALESKKIIAESVQQILKYERNISQDSANEITVTLIDGGVEETKMVEVQTSVCRQHTQAAFSCQQCGKQFTSKKMLYQHLKVHGGDKSAASSSLVNEDVSQAPEQEPACQPIDLTSGVPFGIPCSLVQLNDLEGVKDYVTKSFITTLEGLVVPSQMHYSCALCEQEFKSENQARRHVNRFGTQQTIVQCNQCQRKFHNLDLFNVHYAYIHQPEGAATCITCSIEFKNKADFVTHLGSTPKAHPLSVKLGFKTFIQDACGTVTCPICQKNMWNYPMNIANHTKMHKSFPCPMCQQVFPYKYAWLIHLQAHANSRNLNVVSELSQDEFLKQTELAQFVDKIHSIVTEVESSDFVENNEKFCCSLCGGEVWRQRKNIHKHLDLHARKVLHGIREGRYFCPDCGEDIAANEQSSLDHMTSHGHSAVQFVCVFCTQTFASFEEFKEHDVKKHWLNMYFEKSMCEVCGKELVSRLELKNHVKLHQEKQGLFPCPRCKQSFRFESKLQKHMAKHDNGRDSYACQYCGKLYMTKISLQRHEQVDHMGIRDLKHKCGMCDAQFINATHLRDHVTNKHSSGASYTCHMCGMGFKHLSTCVRHKRVVHGGDTPYVCQDCGEKFPVKKDLQRHMIVHTGVNPFECPSCHKAFSLERTMQEHMDFVHRGMIKFMCSTCGSKFPRKRNLVRHMSTCRRNVV